MCYNLFMRSYQLWFDLAASLLHICLYGLILSNVHEASVMVGSVVIAARERKHKNNEAKYMPVRLGMLSR